MAEETNAGQESQKTVVAFIVGLIIGGLLVWVFTDAPAQAPTDTDGVDTTVDTTTDEETDDTAGTTTEEGEQNTNSTPEQPSQVQELPVGEGAASVPDQPASQTVRIDSATFPQDEGWIGVREYTNESLGYLLGTARFSREQGLVPEEIILLRPTTAGREYAIVYYSENGDRNFNLAQDVQVGGVVDTFTAQ